MASWRAEMLLQLAAWAVILHVGSCFTHFSANVNDAKADLRGTFEKWVKHNDKHYEPGSGEWEARFNAWVGNFERLAARGQQTVLLNGLQDLSLDEFRDMYLGQREKPLPELDSLEEENKGWIYADVTDFPERLDWREQDVVGPIKNQHANGTPCGCCWAFASVAVTECISAMVTGKIVPLSEQQLIDCDRGPPWYDLGCDGGDFEGGILYIQQNKGLEQEDEYPYIGKDDSCKWTKKKKKYGAVDGYLNVPRASFTALTQAVVMHPVATAICCGPYLDYWHAYTGGIMDIEGHPEACYKPMDHAVLAIGYGEEDGKPYWLVKNSWGEKWGENGFFRIPRLADSPHGWGSFHTSPGFPIKRGLNPAVDAFLDKQAALDTSK